MEISVIFAESLYSFKYDNFYESEYEKKLFHWQDFEHIYNKGIENNIAVSQIDQFFDEIFFDREYLIKKIKNCVDDKTLYDIFKPLKNYSSNIIKFEESKGKIFVDYKKRLSRLRLYSLRIDNSCFIITGGVIKFTLKMKDHQDTVDELERIELCRSYLLDNEFTEDDIIDNLYESGL